MGSRPPIGSKVETSRIDQVLQLVTQGHRATYTRDEVVESAWTTIVRKPHAGHFKQSLIAIHRPWIHLPYEPLSWNVPSRKAFTFSLAFFSLALG